jgi:FMN phosphatase YigB (HAD superfamily)
LYSRTVPVRWVLFDWGDTLMWELGGPADRPMALWPEVRAVDGAADVVAGLAARYRVGVASNAAVSDRAMIERALARVSLAAPLSAIFCRRELGFAKAEPAFWHEVSARTAAAAGDIVMIGDDLAQDVQAPRRCGLRAIWFNWKRAPGDPGEDVPVIERLAEVPPLIARMAGRS